MELIDLLLNNKVQAGDALLHAISEEYVEAVEVLLQHEEKTYTPGKPYVCYYLLKIFTNCFYLHEIINASLKPNYLNLHEKCENTIINHAVPGILNLRFN